MRNKIFISHAAPDDNDFTNWLSLKLIALGYEVWCDVLFLDKGADFWKIIDKEIREGAIKFLLATSKIAIKKEGVLKEVAIAEKVKKQLKDDNFIIPLIIDENLSYDDLPPEIIRLNAIDFRKSWATGLKDLLEALATQKVNNCSPNPAISNALYQQIFLHNKGIIERDEIYDSNWFSIQSFPKELRFHAFDKLIPRGFDVRELTFPAVRFKNHLCTFAWEYDFLYHLPQTETYNRNNTIRISTEEILSGNYDTNFIANYECQRLIVQLVNKAFELRMKVKGVREYPMSNKVGYWFEKGKLEKDKFCKVQLVGKQKGKNWHFAISAASKLYPFPVLMVSSHIYFTQDGITPIESKSIQHAARRRQGKNWWNDDWRNKMLAFVKYLSDDETSFYLEVGSEEKIQISNEPIKFIGKVSYNVPEKNTLEDEAEILESNLLDDMDEEMIEETDSQ
ncbi:MAG: toll/interleukin-1 receptor domain-containing protein [Bacteroidetes bacterium]|nr:toll/interleukin-1 receptor domain-containing protein [Bacteroidota bacterium]